MTEILQSGKIGGEPARTKKENREIRGELANRSDTIAVIICKAGVVTCTRQPREMKVGADRAVTRVEDQDQGHNILIFEIRR